MTTMPVAAADVVVVGCGIVGIAAAERLAAGGLSVALVDESGIADGPSGASGGLVRAFDPAPADGVAAWAAEGLDTYLRRGRHGRWPRVREQGALTLLGAGGAERAAAGVATILAAGHAAEILSAGEIRARFAGLTVPDDAVGVYEHRGGWLPAREVAQAMLRDAGPRVTVLAPARATEVVTSGPRVSGVQTTAGRVSAPAVLLAAGVGSTDLALTAGLLLPLRTRAVSYCVFEPEPSPEAVAESGTVDPDDLPTVVDTTVGSWLRRWSSGTAVLAGVVSGECDVPPTVTAGVSAAEQRRVRDVVAHRYPRLTRARITGGVTAYDAMAPGGKGTVTAWPEPAGLVTATGWNGGGFKLAPAIGTHVAARIREVLA